MSYLDLDVEGLPVRGSSSRQSRSPLNSATHFFNVVYVGADYPKVITVASLICFSSNPSLCRYLMILRCSILSIFDIGFTRSHLDPCKSFSLRMTEYHGVSYKTLLKLFLYEAANFSIHPCIYNTNKNTIPSALISSGAHLNIWLSQLVGNMSVSICPQDLLCLT